MPDSEFKIVGVVDQAFKVVISLEFYNRSNQAYMFHNVYIDTGFSNAICMPFPEVTLLGLELATNRLMSMELADGQEINVPVYIGKVNWLGVVQEVLVVALGTDILVGMGLLATCKTTIDRRVVTIE